MGDHLEVSDLTCVKEMIEALPADRQKELFQHFVALNNSAKGVNRPTTPITTFEPGFSTSKRVLSSPETPKHSKKDEKVLLCLK
jgi:hypothetical protein